MEENMALSKEDIFKTGPSPEEEKYNTAVELMDAIDCVERFERAVTSLRYAAAMFEELGDYEDARKRRKQCADKADQIEREGCEKTLQTAKDMYDKAKTKSDYIAANSEYRRLKKFAAYADKAEAGDKACHAGIRKIETRKVYKRRAIALAVIVVICTVIMVTPLSYIVKGFGHKMLGDYKAAINSYDQVEYLPGVGTMKKSCYYKIAKKYDDDNHHKKAMKVYRLAGAYADAEHRTTRYQKRFMRKAEIGTKVYYAGMRWMVLDKALLGEKAMLIRSTPLSKEELPSGKEGENLKGKKLTEFLNGKFTSANFSDREKVMMGKEITAKKRAGMQTVETKKEDIVKNPIFVLPEDTISEYKDNLPPDWDPNGIYPVVWVSFR